MSPKKTDVGKPANKASGLPKKDFLEGDICTITKQVNGVFEGCKVKIVEKKADGAIYRVEFIEGPRKGEDPVIKAKFLEGFVSPPKNPIAGRNRNKKSKFQPE